MSNIVKASDPGALAQGEWQALKESARAVVSSGFLPRAINTAEKAVTLMLAGRELGIGPMQAVRSIHVIDGKPVIAADTLKALVHQRVPGAKFRIAETTEERCTVIAQRPEDTEPTTISYTIAEAKVAGLLGKDNWRKFPAAMLRARAIAAAARAVFPDAAMGVYDPDELGAVTSPEGEIVVMPTQPEPQRKSAPRHDSQVFSGLLEAIGAAATAEDLGNAKELAREVWRDLTKVDKARVKDAMDEAAERVGTAPSDG